MRWLMRFHECSYTILFVHNICVFRDCDVQ